MILNDILMSSYINNNNNSAVNYSRRDENGNNLLHYASYYGKTDKVIILVENHSIPLSSVNKNGQTPLMFACMRGHINSVRFMCSLYVDVNIYDYNGMTPLLYARINCHSNIVRYLVNECNCDTTNISNGIFENDEPDISVVTPPLRQTISSPPPRTRRARRVIRPVSPQRITSPSSIGTNLTRIFQTTRNRAIRVRVSSQESEKDNKKCVLPSFVKLDYIESMINAKKECPICFEEYKKDRVKILDCGHVLCTTCFEKTGSNCYMKC